MRATSRRSDDFASDNTRIESEPLKIHTYSRSPGPALLVVAFSWMGFLAFESFALDGSTKDEIRLIVRGDDMGAAHAINEACIQSYRDGVVRSMEVLVPGPWFMEAAAMLQKQPGLDVGIHLDLTSEWELVKWGSLSQEGGGILVAFVEEQES